MLFNDALNIVFVQSYKHTIKHCVIGKFNLFTIQGKRPFSAYAKLFNKAENISSYFLELFSF